MAREPKTKNSQAADSDSLIVIDFKQPLLPLTWLAIAVGIMLIACSIGSTRWLTSPPYVANLLLAAGVAIVLAAFGGQAAVRGKGQVFAGVAAIAVGLLALLTYEERGLRSDTNRKLELQKKSYLMGSISGLPLETYDVKLKVDNFVPSRHRADLERFEFVIFKSDLDRSGPASLDIDNKDDEAEAMNFEIKQECLVGFLGQEQPLIWRFGRMDNVNVIKEGDTIIAAEFGGDVKVGSCLTAPTHVSNVESDWGLFDWVSSAFAGSMKIDRATLDRALRNLQSKDPDVRRSARLIVSNAEPEEVGYILKYVRDRLKQTPDIYHTKLGVSLALTEMLRRNKSLRDRMKFETADLDMLLDFAGSANRTLRIYAGEFLYDLENPAVARLALPRAVTATNDDARYNWILVSKGGWLRMSKAEKDQLKSTIDQLRALSKSRPKTAALLNSFV